MENSVLQTQKSSTSEQCKQLYKQPSKVKVLIEKKLKSGKLVGKSSAHYKQTQEKKFWYCRQVWNTAGKANWYLYKAFQQMEAHSTEISRWLWTSVIGGSWQKSQSFHEALQSSEIKIPTILSKLELSRLLLHLFHFPLLSPSSDQPKTHLHTAPYSQPLTFFTMTVCDSLFYRNIKSVVFPMTVVALSGPDQEISVFILL